MKYKAKKRFGQNFLNDVKILERIVDIANVDKQTLVIEIGPGQGALTEGLIKKAKKVLAYEIDFDLIRYLKLHFRESDNLEIIEGDFLNRDIDKDRISQKDTFSNTILVANIPYYITSPIITKILTEYNDLDKAVIMVQEEVAKRFTAVPRTKDYGALTVMTSYFADVDYSLSVPRKYFNPEPKVDSAVITLVPHKKRTYSKDKENAFIRFIKYSFSQKRKTWINNLLSNYTLNKVMIEKILNENGLEDSIRAEAASLETFIILFEYFYLKEK